MPVKRVLITGASSGLGREMALQLAREGCRLALTGRREDRLQETAAAVRAAGGEALALLGDVGDHACVLRHYALVKEKLGGLDWAVMNAGVSKSGSALKGYHAADFRLVYESNVFGLVNWIEAVLPDMLAAGAGTIAGIASVAGFRGLPGSGAYSASKAALISYLESLRQELRGSGVKVVTICPGYIRTPMTDINPYPMPFMLEADEAARRIACAIDRGCSFKVVPWQMSLVGRLLKLLPNWLFDLAFAKVKHKPRGTLR